MTNYTFYSDKILQYIEHTLIWINKTKKTFGDTYSTNVQICDNEPGNFNFLKWYAMSYYLQFICLFDSTIEYTIRIGEA